MLGDGKLFSKIMTPYGWFVEEARGALERGNIKLPNPTANLFWIQTKTDLEPEQINQNIVIHDPSQSPKPLRPIGHYPFVTLFTQHVPWPPPRAFTPLSLFCNLHDTCRNLLTCA